MTNAMVSNMPIDEEDHHEFCMDMLHESHNDNSLPLITTTPDMPATDRPVVLYMAPVHKQENEKKCACGQDGDNGASGISKGIQKVTIQ
ncbi:Protein CBG04525 [Caenorhabditis briggsae]|uniref:Protein CBG04525 n=1 Tax=Caenorhabditis briggsae TaxID=6238 RepID=A8WXP2_CAEBR|nr:Protein CBG04525 [Caenorhabditis briggsae]CAP25174.1 Protein CBG04525 [Caenorhabditis briggsae]